MSEPATASVSKGVAWLLLGRLLERVTSMVVLFLLVRLLGPTDFGMMGMASALIAVVQSLTAFGFDWALVRHPSPTREHFDTAWTMQLIVATASALTIGALAVPMAAFYNEPRLVPVIVALAGLHFLSGFDNIGVAYLRREMQFDKEFVIVMTARIASMLVSVPMAFVLQSYWALVLGLAATRVATLVATYLVHPYRPRLSLETWRELISFSGWLQVANILETLRNRLPDFALGRVHGAQPVAVYALANELASLAVTEIAAPVNRVVFSKYSSIQGDSQKLASSYLSVASMLWLVTIPVAIGMACVAKPLVVFLLGFKWIDAIGVIQMLSIAMLGHILTANTQYVFMAKGHPDLNAKLMLLLVPVQAVLLLALVPRWGAYGAAVAHAVAVWVTVPARSILLKRMIGVGLMEVFHLSWRPIMAAAVMTAVVLFLQSPELPGSALAAMRDLAVESTIGAAAFLATLGALWWLSGRPEGSETQLASAMRPLVTSMLAKLAPTRFGAGKS